MKIVEDGTLKGTFKGFKNRETIFIFTNGSKWNRMNSNTIITMLTNHMLR